jgi:hypothetical protein
MKKLAIFLPLILASCSKDSDNLSIINRDLFIGHYCGEVISGGSWYVTQKNIHKSPTDSNKIFIVDSYPYDSVEATVNGLTISIPQRTVHSENYEIVASGKGILDTTDFHLQIIYSGKYILSDQSNYPFTSTVNLFQSYKLTYHGTYTGDSATVVFSTVEDTMHASITFQPGWVPYGWNNIKVSDSECSLSVSADSINDIASGESYKLMGSAQKFGDSLKFSIRAYYHGISPLYFYDFIVSKTNN